MAPHEGGLHEGGLWERNLRRKRGGVCARLALYEGGLLARYQFMRVADRSHHDTHTRRTWTV